MTLDEVFEETAIDPWFLAQIEQIVQIEQALDGPHARPACRPTSCAT